MVIGVADACIGIRIERRAFVFTGDEFYFFAFAINRTVAVCAFALARISEPVILGIAEAQIGGFIEDFAFVFAGIDMVTSIVEGNAVRVRGLAVVEI